MLPLKKKLPVHYLAFIPAIFLLLLAPAFIAGRDAWSLLTIYVGQITTGGVVNAGQFNGGGSGRFNGGGRPPFNGGARPFPGGGSFNGGAGQFPGRHVGQFNGGGPGGSGFSTSSLTLNAPSFYQWLPAGAPEYWKWIGILLAALFVILVAVLLVASKKKLTLAILLKIALVLAIAIPFLLPEMHERYFYLADVLSVIYAFYFPRLFYIAIIMQLCSLLSYAPYLLNTQIVRLEYVAGAVLIIAAITLADLVQTLYPGLRKKPGEPGTLKDEASPQMADGAASGLLS